MGACVCARADATRRKPNFVFYVLLSVLVNLMCKETANPKEDLTEFGNVYWL